MTAMGVTDLASRVAYGYLSDLKIFRISQIVAMTSLIMGVACFFIHYFTSFEALLAFSVLTGGLGFSALGLWPALITECMGVKHLSQVLASSTLITCIIKAGQWPVIGESFIQHISGRSLVSHSFNISVLR